MYHFIINPNARTGKAVDVWTELEQVLIEKKISYQAYFTEYPGHATEHSKKICEEVLGEKHIIVVGGDGTANEAINGISDYDEVIFGAIPVGSGNDLVRGLGLPSDPFVVLEHILQGDNIRLIDHGLLQYFDGTPDRKFDVSSGYGYDANVCYKVQKTPLKKILNRIGLGKLCYYLVAGGQIFVLKPTKATVIVDDTKTKTYDRLLFCASMIHPYEGGGLKLAPEANCSDKRLSVILVQGMSKLKLFIMLPSVLKNKHTKIKGVELFDCESIEIISQGAHCIHLDGELGGIKDHIRHSCTKKQIRMYL